MVEKVGYTKPVTTARPIKKTGSINAPGFADALAAAEGIGGVDGIEATSNIGAIGNIGGLLGAQEVDEREARRRKGVKAGQLTLEALTQLRDALLTGILPQQTLARIEHLIIAQHNATTDPALKSILNEIELRAAVELAKLEMSGIGTALTTTH